MKIVNVIGSCASGGAEILVKDTLILLSKNKKLELELWVMTNVKDSNLQITQNSLNFEKEYVAELNKNGINVRFLEKRSNKDSLKTWLKIRKLYDQVKPDIIHTHLESVTFNTAIGFWGKGAKQIQTIHNIKIGYPKIQKFFLDKILNKNISISKEVTLSMIEAKLNKHKIEEIPNAINLEKFKSIERKIKKPKIYLAVGRLTEQKNHELMIKSYSKFIQKIDNEAEKPILKIVGEGFKKEKLESLIEELEMKNYIQLLGVRDNILELLKEADVYLMTSKWEGFSISLIEAAASGLPIIASNVGSNHLICQEGINGWLFENENEIKLTELLEKIQGIEMEKRKEFSKNSIEISIQYDLSKIQEKLFKLYEKVNYE